MPSRCFHPSPITGLRGVIDFTGVEWSCGCTFGKGQAHDGLLWLLIETSAVSPMMAMQT